MAPLVYLVGCVYLTRQIFDFPPLKNKIGSESCPQKTVGAQPSLRQVVNIPGFCEIAHKLI
jgi:hypothetical protein